MSKYFLRRNDLVFGRFFERNFSKEEMDSKPVSHIKRFREIQKKLSLILD